MDTLQINFLIKTYELTRNEIISLQSSFYSGLILTLISILAGAIAWSFKEGFKLTDLKQKIGGIIFPTLVVFYLIGTSLTLCSTITMIINLGHKNFKIEEQLKGKKPRLIEKYGYEHQVFRINKDQPFVVRWLNSKIFPEIAKANLIHSNFPYIILISLSSSLLIGVFLSVNILLSNRSCKVILFGISSLLISICSFSFQNLFIALVSL